MRGYDTLGKKILTLLTADGEGCAVRTVYHSRFTGKCIACYQKQYRQVSYINGRWEMKIA